MRKREELFNKVVGVSMAVIMSFSMVPSTAFAETIAAGGSAVSASSSSAGEGTEDGASATEGQGASDQAADASSDSGSADSSATDPGSASDGQYAGLDGDGFESDESDDAGATDKDADEEGDSEKDEDTRKAADISGNAELTSVAFRGLTMDLADEEVQAKYGDSVKYTAEGTMSFQVKFTGSTENPLVPGDTVSFDLPAEAAEFGPLPADAATAYETLFDDGYGNPVTGAAVGTWSLDGARLTLTVGELSSASEDAQFGVFSVDISVPFKLMKDALGEEPTQKAWTMLTQDGGAVTAVADLPVVSEVADFVELEEDDADQPVADSEEGDEEDAAVPSGKDDEASGDEAEESARPLSFMENLFNGFVSLFTSSEDDSDPMTTVGFELDCTGSASYVINFADNANPDRPANDDIAAASKLTFKVEGDDTSYDFTWENARDLLHMSREQFDAVSVAGTDDTSIKETYTAANLPVELVTTTTTTTPSTTQKTDPETGEPMVDENGKPVMEDPTVDTDVVKTAITWSLTPDFTQWTKDAANPDWNNSYLFVDNGDGTYQANLTLVREYHFEKVDGETQATTEELLELLKETASHFEIDLGDGGSYNLQDVMASPDIKWDYADGLLTFYNLPAYTLQGGKPIDVSIVYKGAPENPTEATGIYYTAVYNNAAAPNHGADDKAVFPGGTLRLIRSGITDFSATKVWVDTVDDADRSAVTYKLYRYREGQTFTSAAPVVGADGAYVTVEVVPPAAGDGNSVTIDGAMNVNLNGLPKYDPEGYEYYYELRPDTGSDSGYESIYGTIDETGANNYDDTLPAKVDSRDGHDAGIYDGGTLTVRRSGTTSIDPTKTWRAAAFQNQLANVTCIFTLQRSSDEGTNWSNVVVDDTDVTCAMGGFSEEQLTKSFSDCGAITDWPAYDELGRPLQYRWVESSVKQGETLCDFDSSGEKPTFTLTLKDPVTGADVDAKFISTIDPDTGNIINAYSATTTLQIQKWWYAGDDALDNYTQQPQAGENDWPADAGFTASFRLYQDGALVTDGLYVDGTTHTIDLSDVLGGDAKAVESADDPYNLTLENVSQFTDDGIRHSYLILENGIGTAADTDRVYDADHLTTKFYNRPTTEGESSEINVSKRWYDAGDGHGDAVVKLELVAKHDLAYTKDAKDDQGNVLHNAGDIYKNEGEVVSTVQVSAKTEWFDTAYIPVGGLDLSDFTVREVSVTMNGVESEVKNGDDEIKAALEAQGFEVTDNDLAMFPNHQAVIVNSHVYSVGAFTTNGTLNSLEVPNTRVGWTSLDASKAWVDEGADKDLRPDCSVSLAVTSGAAEVVTAGNGAMSIRSYGVDYPVMVSVDGAEAVQCTTDLLTMLKSQDAQTWTISYLPKYDKYGSAITYSLYESCDDLGDYQSMRDVTGGSADGLHYIYSAGYDFTNQRAVTTSVSFTKKWRDDYIYNSGMRPDIFLTLYKSDSEGFAPVEGFIDVKWGLDGNNDGTGSGGSGVVSTSNGANLQTITINDLPKYDSKGYEITYYASESMSVKGSTLDYQPVYYDANDTVVSADNGTVLTGDAAKGDGTAVEAGGTFNNDIAAVQSVKGEKAWADVPTGFLAADFPSITITIKHNQPSHTDQPDVLAAVIHLDPDDFTGSRWSYETGCMTNADGEYVDEEGNVVKSADQAAKFPMYDEYGKKYTYYVQEYDIEIDPAAPVVGEVDQAAQDAGVTPGGIIYHPEYDQSGKSFRITNTYKGGDALRELDVTKAFDAREASDKFPEKLEFTLYRTYYSKTAGYVTPQRVDALTMTAAEFDAAIQGDGSAELTKSFTGLEVYAPNGYPWEYYVVESGTPGYTQAGKVTATGGNNGAGIADYEPAAAQTGQGKGAVAGVVTLNGPAQKGAVEFDNSYTPNELTLTGSKVWDDYDNAFGTRGQFSIDGFVTLKRANASGSMTEEVTLQTGDSTAANYIAWDTTTDAGKWTYTISNLEYWAPDSTPWKYTVTEGDIDATTGYKAVTKTATCTNEKATAADATTYEGSFTDLENALDGSVTVTKAWDDGDTHSLRPTQIKTQLQARIAGGEWQDAATFLGTSYATDDDQTLTGGMTYTWSKLPTKKMDGDALKTVEYRVVETQIGAAGNHEAITPDAVGTTAADGASYDSIAADCYTVSATTAVEGNKTTTAITNSRDYVNLTVTKAWTDFDNEWGTRPENDSVTMKIESSADGTTWTQIKKADGSDLTITLTSDKRSVTVGNLVRTHDGTPVMYRAIEETGAASNLGGYVDGYRIGDSGSYVDAADFAGASAAAAGTAKDPATITEEVNNSLKYVDVTGTKQFDAYENGSYYDLTAKGAAPEMHVWRTTDGTTWEKAYLADGTTEPTVEWTSGTDGAYDFKIANLPAADNQGREYTYQVSEDETWANEHGFVVTQEDEHGNKTTVDRTGDTVVWTANEAITNTPTKFRIDKNFSDKIYTDMSKVSGGTYTLTGAFADGSQSKTLAIAAGESKKSSILDGLLIPGNAYTLTETAAPDGYKTLGAPVTVEVDSEGSISTTTETQINGAAEGTAVDGVSVLMVVDDPVIVQLTKVIEGSTDKSGVAFSLTPADTAKGYLLDSTGAKQASAAYTTDADGSIIMTGLVAGQTYTLTETSSPYPNALLDAYSFTVNGDGSVTPAATNANWSAASFEAGVAKLSATDPYISLALKKLDADGNEVSTDGRTNGNDAAGMGTWTITPLGDAAFADGTTEAQTLSYEDGLVNLKHGCSYTVVEATAPWGYELNGETLTVAVSNLGVISIASDAGDATAYAVETASRNAGDATGAVIALKDNPTQVTLNKVSTAAGNPAVRGATFQVTGWFDDGSTSKDFSTGADASSVTITGLRTDVEYEVTETAAPYGYERESSTLKFTLNADGTLSTKVEGADDNGWSIDADADGVSFTKADEPVEVRVTKSITVPDSYAINGDGVAIGADSLTAVGATFTITGNFAKSTTELESKTNTYTVAQLDDGTYGFDVTDLVVGESYTVQETLAPEGYKLAGDLTMVVEGDGTIVVAKAGETVVAIIDGDVPVLDVPDDPIQISVTKQNMTDESLEGATWTLNGHFAGMAANAKTTIQLDGTNDATVSQYGLVAGEHYILTETHAPDGHVCTAVVEFDVDSAGNVVNAVGTNCTANAEDGELSVQDKAIEVSVKKTLDTVDFNTNGTKASFQVVPVGDSYFFDINTGAKSTDAHTVDIGSIADGAGEAVIGDLVVGCSYKITETDAPAGFKVESSSATFKVNDDGTIVFAGDVPNGYSIENTGTEVSLNDHPMTFTVTKTNADGTVKLLGAEYTLAGDLAEGASNTATTDANGTAVFSGLLPDVEYTLTETAAPAGYELSEGSVTFVLDKYGKVTAYGASADSELDGFAAAVTNGAPETTQADAPIEMTLSKFDENRNPIKGSTFTVTGIFASEAMNGELGAASETRTFSDTADTATGEIALDRLVAGQKYTITETAPPAGYVNASGTAQTDRFSMTILVDETGAYKVVGDPNGDWMMDSSDEFSLTDVRTSIEFTKWGAEATDKTGIDGAVFTVTGTFADGSTEKTFTTGTDTAMQALIVGNEYTVTETTAPEGYVACADDFTFTVNQDGTINATPTEEWKIATGGKGIVQVDSLTGYGLYKVSNENNALLDAQFELTGKVRLTDGSISADDYTMTLDAIDGIAGIQGLIDGETYRIAETKAPDCHVPDTTAYAFSIKDGRIVSDDTNAAWAISDDGASLTMTDAVIRPTLHKFATVGQNQVATPGAQFQVYKIEGAQAVIYSSPITTDASGNVKFPALLVDSLYEVKEITAPNGCLPAADCTIAVDAAGTVSIDGTFKNWSISDDGTMLTLEDDLVTATLHKKGETATAATTTDLSDAVYELTGDFATDAFGIITETRTFTTGTDGTVALTGLVAGKKYTVHEATPPAGYVAGPDFVIEVSGKGVVSVEGDSASVSSGNVVTVVDERTKPLMGKCAFSNDNFDGAGPAIKGGQATFTFKGVFADSDAEQTKTVTIDASRPVDGNAGTAEYDPTSLADYGFVVGKTYEVTETSAPSGYAADSDTIQVKVKPDGTFEFVDDDHGLYVLDDGNTLISRDTQIVLTFDKKGLDGNSVTEYCEYQIWPADGSTFADGTTAARTIRLNYTEPGNAASFDDSISDLLANNTYVMKELVAPAGYAPSDVEFSFTVDMYGCAEAVESVDGWGIGQDGMQIQASDVSNSIEIYKVSGDQPLAGAEFTLVDNGDADGNNKTADVKVATTTNNYWPHIDKLLCGHTYTLTETTAPAGFAKAPGSVTVSVSDKGVITFAASEGADDYWQLDADNATIPTIVCTDKLNEVQVQKVTPVTGTGGTVTYQPLEGVELKLSGQFVNATGRAQNGTQTFSTDEDGYVTFTGVVADSEYEFSETSTVDGYSINTSKATVKWDADGNCTIVNANGAPVEVVDGALRIKNDPTSVKVLKTDDSADANPLAGAVFTITPTRDSSFADGTTAAKTITTGEDGTAELSGQLVWGGFYTIQETTAAAGYKVNSAVAEFHVPNNGKPSHITYSDGATGWSFNDGVFTVVDEPATITISKFDGDTPLDDYSFRIEGPIYDGAGNKIADQLELDSTDHSYSITGQLAAGEAYTLTETRAPDKHVLTSGSFAFTIDENGLVVADAAQTSTAFTVVDDGRGIAINNDPVKVHILKTDSTANAQPIPGAEYTLTRADDPDFKLVVKTGKDGKATIDALDTDVTYTVTETKAPVGCTVGNALSFTVDRDTGAVTAVGDVADDWTVAQDGSGLLTNADDWTALSLNKVAAGSNTALAGSEFKVEGTFAAENGVDTSDEPLVIKPGTAQDTLVGKLIVGEEYTISETKAPVGYELCAPATIKVNDDGTLELAGDHDAWTLNDDGISLTAEDDPIEATVSKANAEGDALVGAIFQVTGEFADGSGEQTLDTAAGSTASIEALLVAGKTYTISETKAPAGYELCAPATFKVNADGTLAFVGDHDAWTLNAAKDALAAKDAPIEATFSKTDMNGADRYAAVFSIGPNGDSKFADGTTAAKELDTDINSSVSLSGQLVAGETYTITETKAPLGYELCAPATFKVNADGTLAFVGDHDAWTLNAAKDGLVAKDALIEATVTKNDLSGNGLSGAVFKIEGLFANAEDEQILDMGKQSTAAIAGPLMAGETYTITETKAPAGYELCAPATFKVNDDGTLAFVGDHDAWTLNAAKDGLVAKDAPIKATVSKADAAGNAINGAIFQVTGEFADGSGKQTLDTAAGSTASIEALLVAGNSYILTEATAPLGYACRTAELSFTVDEQGAITFDTGDTAYELGAGNAISLKDDQITFTVNKLDQYSDEPLSGAEYTIKPKTSSDKLADGNAGVLDAGEVKALTGEDGTAVFTGNLVAGNSYTLEETKAPVGYTRDTTVYELVVNPGGEVVRKPAEALNDKDAYVTASATTLTDLKTSLVLNNVSNEDGSKLPQAHYVVKAGDKYLQQDGSLGDDPYEFVTDEEGKLDLTGVLSINVDYVLEQVDASNGYKLNHDSFAFSLDEKGNVIPKDQGEEGDRYVLNEDGVLLKGADDPIKLTLAKTDMDGKALDDAVFTVTPDKGSAFADGAESHELKVTADDASLAVLSAQLIDSNSYVVSETKAPAGYELAPDAKIVVDEDGKMTLEDETGAWSLDEGGTVLTAKDGTIDMSLTKVADTADIPLEGAVFQIAGKLVAEDGSVSDTTLTLDATGKDGLVDLRGKLVANQTYTLTETKAPAGYKLSDPVSFTVDEGGNAKLEGKPAGWSVSETGAEFKVADDPLVLVLSKVSAEDGKSLAGAEFKVEGKFAGGETSLETKTDDAGMSELSAELVLGETYTLTETKAPDGYDAVDPVKLSVAEDGSFELQGDYDSKAWQIQSDGKTLQVADPLTPASEEEGSGDSTDSGSSPFTGDSPLAVGVLAGVGLLGAGTAAAAKRRRKRGAHEAR